MKQINRWKIAPVLLALVLGGCEDFFNPENEGVRRESDSYEKVSDVQAAFFGLSATFQEVPEHTILLSGLRGDLMEPTENAPTEFWDVHRYQAGEGNSLTDPSVYYRMVINSNDFIRHAIGFYREQPGLIPENIIRGMVGEALRYRAWSYLTLGKLYGEAAYFDYAVVDYNDLSDTPVLPFDELLEEVLISLYTGVDGFNGRATFNWNDVTGTADESWNRMGIQVNALLGELQLWRGDYRDALTNLLTIPNTSSATDAYTLKAFTAVAEWRYFFSQTLGSAGPLREMVSAVPFTAINRQQNHLQYYFDDAGTNVYYIRPSQAMVNLSTAADNNQNRRRYTYMQNTASGNYFINKYSIDKAYQDRDATIPVYRAADIHLMIAECLNRLGFATEAMVFINGGPKTYWNAAGYFRPPFNNPIYTTNLREGAGIRGRLGLAVRPVPIGTAEEVMRAIDGIIAEETALECAYEGKRFFTLMRLARYWDEPEILADAVAAKFPDGEQEAYRSKLMDPDNWFVAYDPLKQ